MTSLEPLPEIGEIYAKMKVFNVYSIFDLKNGCHHMVFADETRPKSAFVTPMGNFEFTHCPIGLAHAPVYVQ